MSDLIQNKMNLVLGDLARSAKFKCQIFPPKSVKFKPVNSNGEITSSPEISQYLDYFCYAASFPGQTAEAREFKYFGKTIPIPGDVQQTQKWTATFYNDEFHNVRKLFLDWMNSNQTFVSSNPKQIRSELTSIHIYQLNYEMESEIAVYSMWNCFPTNISDIEVSYDSVNQVETFTVDFSFSHFTINELKSNSGNLTDILIQDGILGLVGSIASGAVQSLVNYGSKLVSSVISGASWLFNW